MEIRDRIRELAAKKKALILAHNYQRGDVQDLAHHTGDSLELSRIAEASDAPIVVFCGVHFMAESAVLLSPKKKVLLPDPDSGCPMADMAQAEDVLRMRREHPGAQVVTYINSSASVKAVSDVCCTSANAAMIVQRMEADEIIFVPDKNLGSYVQRFTPKKIRLWKGFCPVHDRFTVEELRAVKERHPDAIVVLHPECRPEAVDLADEVLSTGGMVRFVKQTGHRKIIIGTEREMLHKLKAVAPDKEYILASDSFLCPDMKRIDPGKILRSLETESPVVSVEESVAAKARVCLERMLALSR
jgi:quinolinate synthase